MNLQEFSQRYSYDERRDRLGKGGFGSVFKAYDNVLDCYVAIKIAQVDPDYDNLRLSHEVEKAARLEHVNVAHYDKCMSFKTLTGEVDIAIMQYYENGSLSNIIDSGMLDAEHRYDLLTQILEGIAYLHSEGIIHRDLKPQNVLIARRGDRFIPKITDFGISKQLDDGQSSAVSNSVLGGTRSYASPEQLKERTIRKNTDLWSFGVIAYQMLVGALPFDCGSFSPTSEEGRQEQFRQMMSGLLPEAVATIPEPWQRLIRECLTVDNEKRIAHAEDCLAIIHGEEATAVAIEVDNPATQLDVDSETAVEPEPQPEPKVAPKSEPKVAPKPEQKQVPTPLPTEPKKSKWWLWLLLLLIVAGGAAAWFMSSPKDEPMPTPDEQITIVADSIADANDQTDEEPSDEQSTTPEEVQPAVIEEEEEPIPTHAPVLRLTSNSRVTTEHSGTNGTIRYSLENPVSGVNISVSDNANWLTTSVSGSTISYTASANESQSSRTATITVSYGDQSFEVVVTQNGKPATIYAVGDYYNVNGVEGVVFEISDGGRHGKIVSVDQAEGISWGPLDVNAPADSSTDGKANTDAIMALSDRDSYQAFTWCRGKGSNWYLPALNELQAISRNRDAINATLRARDYTEIFNNYYWSSTEFNEFAAWHVDMHDGDAGGSGKFYNYYVRAVSAF